MFCFTFKIFIKASQLSFVPQIRSITFIGRTVMLYNGFSSDSLVFQDFRKKRSSEPERLHFLNMNCLGQKVEDFFLSGEESLSMLEQLSLLKVLQMLPNFAIFLSIVFCSLVTRKKPLCCYLDLVITQCFLPFLMVKCAFKLYFAQFLFVFLYYILI